MPVSAESQTTNLAPLAVIWSYYGVTGTERYQDSCAKGKGAIRFREEAHIAAQIWLVGFVASCYSDIV
jgi:hypothetical protein